MNCSRCGRAIAGVFPGTKVVCECGAENVAHAPTDDPYRTPAVVDRSTPDQEVPAVKKERPHPCPRCSRALGRVSAGVYACAACEGTFLDESALHALVERARNETETETVDSLWMPPITLHAKANDVRYLPCPICAERMNRSLFGKKSGILVDVCAQHGTWFDHGEVETAVRFARSHEVFAEPARAAPSAEDIQRRADVEALHVKEGIERDTADAAWRAQSDGFEFTFIERLAIAIRWLRGD